MHTPFHEDGTIDLSIVAKQAEHLARNKTTAAFICGTTGENHSLRVEERMALATRWLDVTRGSELRVIVHVGANSLEDASALAAHAQQAGAWAICAIAPSYFKPQSLESLIACCERIAAAAPDLPFYYYDIPAFTGVHLSTADFLSAASARIPTLVGTKFTNPDLAAYLRCVELDGGRWDMPWGIDEWLLGALAVGARGAVGSSFNFAAPIYHRLIAAFERGDRQAAKKEQFRSVQLITLLARYGYMGAAKATMQMLGVDVGSARLPNTSLSKETKTRLRAELEALGFFDWILGK